ncbi:type III pantothenate kinase [Aquirufa sp. OSTEICH-129A]
MMVLCLDFGNSSLKYAWFEAEKIRHTGTIAVANKESISNICQGHKIESIILSSVIDLPADLVNFLKRIAPFHQLNASSSSLVNYSKYDKSTLGVDRIALAEGAHMLYPDQANVTICLGTCITYNWVLDGFFTSGAISPGLMMRAKSMHDYTAHLPMISPQMDFPLLANSTYGNLLAGTMFGMLLEIQGYITEIRKIKPSAKILLCGGDAPYFIERLKGLGVQYEANLIWKGLAGLGKLNLGLSSNAVKV